MNNDADKRKLIDKDIRRHFERAAKGFDDADFVHTQTREGLLSRLAPLSLDAGVVVDLGSATGTAQRALRKRFRRAHIVSIDIARNMLHEGRAKKTWFANASFVQTSATCLPFRDQFVDVIFANMLLPWVDDPALVFTEVARVLRKGGVFAFATLGPDSLQQIRQAWQRVDDDAHVNHFMDMHDLGDGLVRAGLQDPVLDVDRLTVNYQSAEKIFCDLTAVGGRNALRQRKRSLTGKGRIAAVVAELERTAVDGKLSLDLELVYGHCWGVGPKTGPANFQIDATQIPLRRRQ